MEREIKFRAWWPGECFQDGKGRMFEKQEVSGDGQAMNLEGGWDYTGDEDKAIIMQYTGLKDKNGKEIYEGDIVNQYGNVISEVTYHDGSFMTDLGGGALLELSQNGNRASLEVIGNIYEHSHLLENAP